MQEQFFVQFTERADLNQLSSALRKGGVAAPAVALLDEERREKYLPLLGPVRSKSAGILQGFLICIVTTFLGLTAVVVDDAGYLLSLAATGVLLVTFRRKEANKATPILSVQINTADVDNARSTLVQFGAVALLGPVDAEAAVS